MDAKNSFAVDAKPLDTLLDLAVDISGYSIVDDFNVVKIFQKLIVILLILIVAFKQGETLISIFQKVRTFINLRASIRLNHF